MTRSFFPALLVLAALASFATPAAAQGASGFFGPGTTYGEPTQVLSANPFGLVMDFYNAEYELKVADAVTAGVGATRMPRDGTFPGIGFDLNHSDAITDHALISSGIGMKRLIGRDTYAGLTTITTLRLNIGLGF